MIVLFLLLLAKECIFYVVLQDATTLGILLHRIVRMQETSQLDMQTVNRMKQ
jgi:hypothetical protein